MPYYNYNPYGPGTTGFGTAGQNSLYGTLQQPMGMTGQQNGMPQQQYMIWVEGEVGAKAFQQPPGLPANMPIPLWDSTDQIIYLKSWNPMGMPNQMQKLPYEFGQTAGNLTGATGQSNAMSQGNQNGISEGYATKDDLQKMKEEILSAMQGQSKSNGYSGNNKNNGMNNGGGNMNNGKSSV